MATCLGTEMRKVQVKLNKMDLYVLGLLLGQCSKIGEHGDVMREQVLLAMAPELDSKRVSVKESFDLCERLTDGEWV